MVVDVARARWWKMAKRMLNTGNVMHRRPRSRRGGRGLAGDENLPRPRSIRILKVRLAVFRKYYPDTNASLWYTRPAHR